MPVLPHMMLDLCASYDAQTVLVRLILCQNRTCTPHMMLDLYASCTLQSKSLHYNLSVCLFLVNNFTPCLYWNCRMPYAHKLSAHDAYADRAGREAEGSQRYALWLHIGARMPSPHRIAHTNSVHTMLILGERRQAYFYRACAGLAMLSCTSVYCCCCCRMEAGSLL
jgi:hypothetical protein